MAIVTNNIYPSQITQCLILINNTRGHNMASNINETGVTGYSFDKTTIPVVLEITLLLLRTILLAKSEIQTLQTNTAKLNADNNLGNRSQTLNL